MARNKGIDLYVQDEEIVDLLTGEVVKKRTKRIKKKSKQPDYIKIYLDGIKHVEGRKIIVNDWFLDIMRLAPWADEDEQRFDISTFDKQCIMEKYNMKSDALKKNIEGLVTKKILLRIDSNIFKLNPEIIGKGDWNEIEELRKRYKEYGYK